MIDPISKWLIPISFATSVVGGSAWLTTMHNLAAQNHFEILDLKTDYKKNKSRVYDKINIQEDRLGRMEGKIDLILHIVTKEDPKK